MDITTIVTVAVLAILIVTLILVAMLLYAKAKLTPSGKVTITINGEKELSVSPGSSLLTTLSNEKIFLPSACGGSGKQQKNNWRLGCQVKVKEDLEIIIPEEVLGIKKWECEVISNRNVATFIKEFIVKLPEGENLKFRSGGYIKIDIPPCEVDYSKDIYV